jgi:hypothetical protein
VKKLISGLLILVLAPVSYGIDCRDPFAAQTSMYLNFQTLDSSGCSKAYVVSDSAFGGPVEPDSDPFFLIGCVNSQKYLNLFHGTYFVPKHDGEPGTDKEYNFISAYSSLTSGDEFDDETINDCNGHSIGSVNLNPQSPGVSIEIIQSGITYNVNENNDLEDLISVTDSTGVLVATAVKSYSGSNGSWKITSSTLDLRLLAYAVVLRDENHTVDCNVYDPSPCYQPQAPTSGSTKPTWEKPFAVMTGIAAVSWLVVLGLCYKLQRRNKAQQVFTRVPSGFDF